MAGMQEAADPGQEIKWENNHKEAYCWRLTVDGIPLLTGGGEVWVRGEARPRRIAGYAPTEPLLCVACGPIRASWGMQVEPRLGTTTHYQAGPMCGLLL